MSPEERSTYISEHRAKERERKYIQIHRPGSKRESTGPIFLEADTQNHNTAATIDKTVKLLWTNAGQYETMLSQLLRDTEDPEEQAIILQQLQAVMKKKILTPWMLLMILCTCATITQNKWPMICSAIGVPVV